MKYGNRSLWKRLLYSPIAIIVAAVVLFFLIRGGIGIHEKTLVAQQRLDQAQTELADLQHQQQTLSASIAQLSTNDGIEAALREKYHAVKPGESVAVIIDTPTSSSENGGNDKLISSSTSTKSWWGNILRLIGF